MVRGVCCAATRFSLWNVILIAAFTASIRAPHPIGFRRNQSGIADHHGSSIRHLRTCSAVLWERSRFAPILTDR